MRWTHRTYPYGPVWLLLTIPFYILGFGKFTLTLFWFKVIGLLSYLSSVWFIKKILTKANPKYVTAGLVLFALNPLVLIESLVNAHIDISMTAFLLAAIYLMNNKKKLAFSWLSLIISAGVKFVTISVIPVWIWWKGKVEKFEKAIYFMLIFSSAAIIYVIYARELLPWYFLPTISLTALVPKRRYLTIFITALSFGLLLRYAPFLLKGEYSVWVKTTRNILTIIPPLTVFIGVKWKKREHFF
jgi:hypothetical protein